MVKAPEFATVAGPILGYAVLVPFHLVPEFEALGFVHLKNENGGPAEAGFCAVFSGLNVALVKKAAEAGLIKGPLT